MLARRLAPPVIDGAATAPVQHLVQLAHRSGETTARMKPVVRAWRMRAGRGRRPWGEQATHKHVDVDHRGAPHSSTGLHG